MKKKLVAVVGYGNAGKSTIIQSLTGCSGRGYEGYVEDHCSNESVYVFASSPQENPYGKAPTREDQKARFQQDLEKLTANCRGVVIAIQPTNPRVKVAMEDIFEIALALGFECWSFWLSPYYDGRTVNEIDLASRTPSKVKTSTLDARRFALKNANAIQTQTRIMW